MGHIKEEVPQGPLVREEEYRDRLNLYRIEEQDLSREEKETIPARWPVFETFVIDGQGRTWVTVNTEDHFSGTTFSVFDENGEQIATVDTPYHLHIKHADNRYLYGDKMNHSGVQTLMKFRISE